MNELLRDLEKLVEKHKQPESPSRIVWVPICEHYKSAFRAGIYDEQGGDTVSTGKQSIAKVLWWVKLEINPEECPVIRQIEARKVCQNN